MRHLSRAPHGVPNDVSPWLSTRTEFLLGTGMRRVRRLPELTACTIHTKTLPPSSRPTGAIGPDASMPRIAVAGTFPISSTSSHGLFTASDRRCKGPICVPPSPCATTASMRSCLLPNRKGHTVGKIRGWRTSRQTRQIRPELNSGDLNADLAFLSTAYTSN